MKEQYTPAQQFSKSLSRKIKTLYIGGVVLVLAITTVFAKPDYIPELRTFITKEIRKQITEYSTNQPRMRVSRSASQTLSTTWTKVDFTGTSTYNINTFVTDPTSGNPVVYWDATNKIFKFYNTTDVNYELLYSGQVSSTLLTTPVNLRMRITIPNGVSSGVDIHFPNPDGAGYMDVCPASYISSQAFSNPLPIYIAQSIRTNGFFVEVALSNGTLGTVTLDNQSLLIQTTATQ